MSNKTAKTTIKVVEKCNHFGRISRNEFDNNVRFPTANWTLANLLHAKVSTSTITVPLWRSPRSMTPSAGKVLLQRRQRRHLKDVNILAIETAIYNRRRRRRRYQDFFVINNESWLTAITDSHICRVHPAVISKTKQEKHVVTMKRY